MRITDNHWQSTGNQSNLRNQKFSFSPLVPDVSNNPIYDPNDLIQGIMEFSDSDIDIQRLKSEVQMI
jgi:hypothetical protein